ncbi:hypothetical protein Q3V30_12910 [Erwinia pyri]|uniref:Uncharacterized protein n=1 Tax=Erwinia pyri TaxID=3062598 RepID=A0AA50DJY4_9GAMM|nr:hypothetical protein [Erwinia sp. DE2]WLS77385.1 hypothetical protein Q3V30_12910 [Erwinia sp. DE2]
MNFSLFSGDIDLTGMPEGIKELRLWWEFLYDKCPVVAIALIMMIPIIILYAIYTLGTIFKKERSIDQAVYSNHRKAKKRGKKK